uniref:C-type lectin domain-containing protein n=1 Tax=Magallana gigas TaxID=29159 RepID=K1Q756_MAGGI
MGTTPEELATLTTAVFVLNFPRKKKAEESCTAPGYISDPEMGCYRMYKERKTSADAKQQCANDGGRLLLINSAAEFTKLVSLLSKIELLSCSTKRSTVSVYLRQARETLFCRILTETAKRLVERDYIEL